jgi:Dyp-type peroxidase family
MEALHELDEPISQELLKNLKNHVQKPLESLQGNILKGHGRDRSIHIFLKFKNGRGSEVKQWIKSFADRLTSAQQQLDEAGMPHETRPMFRSFLLSAKGYEYLLPGFSAREMGFDRAFLNGMKMARHRLNDPCQQRWDVGFQQEIHAMVLLADKHPDDNGNDLLVREENELRTDIEAHTKICTVERGKIMRWPDPRCPSRRGYSVEHFGYLDALSHPLFFKNEIALNGIEPSHWNPGVGPNRVLARDPYGREYDSGSYLVFRKLEQHVRDFEVHVRALAATLAAPLTATAADVERVKALVMGRFRDGTPIVLESTPTQPCIVPNDFNYTGDPDGQKCPIQAHARKVNSRRQGRALIVRRGVTYGDRVKEPKDNPSLDQLPNKDVGILFMCYQRDIAKQFELLQLQWANDPRHPSSHAPGVDPIIGQPDGMGAGEQKWPGQWDAPRNDHKPFHFHGFVELKGGEYFFAPSKYFLKNIQALLV